MVLSLEPQAVRSNKKSVVFKEAHTFFTVVLFGSLQTLNWLWHEKVLDMDLYMPAADCESELRGDVTLLWHVMWRQGAYEEKNYCI
jgi:hypothetical protein